MIRERGAKPLTFPQNANKGLSEERDDAISIIRGLGRDALARSIFYKVDWTIAQEGPFRKAGFLD